MKKINLRELYPDVYTTDFFVDVTEEVYKIEYYTIANQKQARYNIDKKTKATATVQKKILAVPTRSRLRIVILSG